MKVSFQFCFLCFLVMDQSFVSLVTLLPHQESRCILGVL